MFEYSDHFTRREDPFEMFNKFFQRDFRDFGFDDDEDDDFFSFGSSFGNFGKFGKSFGNHQMQQSTSGSGRGSVSKSVQKTTQIM
jgi:hypothetical protein